MNIIGHQDRNYQRRLRKLAAPSSLFNPAIEKRTQEIVKSVSLGGDASLAKLTARFDGAKLDPGQFAITRAELVKASLKATTPIRKAVMVATANIAAFSRRSLRKKWNGKNAQGAQVGEKYDPFQRVGIYIPGGTAPLVSTALMTVVLARVAGCPEIVVCTPPRKDGTINSSLLFAINTAGATEIYRVGGAQAVTAMALGTKSIKRVQKIFGPGNAYVVAAKRLLFGHVAIDLLPGPSEVLVLADDTAEPRFIAADLLAQAEHGSGHERVWLITPSAQLVKAVEKEITKQLPKLSRKDFIQRALKRNGWLIHVNDMDEGIRLANTIAPEHCEIMTRKAEKVSERIVTAGAIFLGRYSPTVTGDYVAGPSHTLPTGGAGASFAGLTVDQFQRRTSVVRYDKPALKKTLTSVQEFAGVEGLDAHARSAAIRLEKKAKRSR